jgi:hypothetical protein
MYMINIIQVEKSKSKSKSQKMSESLSLSFRGNDENGSTGWPTDHGSTTSTYLGR